MEKKLPTVVQPVDHIDNYAILDFNAVMKHSMGMGKDPDCLYGSATGREINSAEHTFRVFLENYFIEILNSGFTPRQILVAHDAGHEYRSGILPEYKAKRDKKKADTTQTDIEYIKEYEKVEDYAKRFLAYMGCTQLRVKGVEGDDIIAYLCQLPGNKQIFTVDADMLALSDTDVMVHLKGKPVYINDFDIDNLTKNMLPFVEPFLVDGRLPKLNVFRHLCLFKSIVGDSSDEYKGISGMGEKAWLDMVTEFEDDGLAELSRIVDNKCWKELEGILATYDEGPHKGCKAHKMLTKIYDNRSAWRTCWLVAKLHPELCWKPARKKLTTIDWFKRVPNESYITKILERTCALEFKEELEVYLPKEWLIDANNFEEADIAEFAEMCEQSPHVSFDYEGFAEKNENFIKASAAGENYVDVVGQEITGVSFNFGDNLQYTCYITANHNKSANVPKEVILRFLQAIPPEKVKVAHNSVFEDCVTQCNFDNYEIPIGSLHDTMIMSVYDDENRQSHGLKTLSHDLLSYKQGSYRDTLDAAGASNMQEISAEDVLRYGLDDSIVTGHLYDLLKLSLLLQGTWDFYRDHEPYVNHRFSVSHRIGVDIDYEALQDIANEDRDEINTSMGQCRAILEEHCSKPNREAAKRFFDEEKKWLESSARKKYGQMEHAKVINRADAVADEIEAMDIADDTMMEIANAIRQRIPAAKGKKAKESRALGGVDQVPLIAWIVKFELHKAYKKLVEGSVYVPYREEQLPASFTPTAKNLDAVAEKLGLPMPGTAAQGKLSAWELEIREQDFETGYDKFEEFNDDQKKFIEMLREAKKVFAPAKRDCEVFKEFETFCCGVLGLEGKTIVSGTELNMGSPNQMKELLYCMLDLPVRLRGKPSPNRKDLGFWEGSPSTDSLARDTALSEDIAGVEGMEWKEDVINLVKSVTECQTRFSLYHNSYPLFKHPKTGRVHPGLRNCGTVTKRPSGSSPNILQVSKHQKKGVMRSIFVPPRGYVVVPIDFSGQELRIQASVTKDPNLLSVYLGQELTDQYLSGEVLDITYEMVKDKKDLKDLHGLTASGITQHFGLDAAGKLVAGHAEIKWSPETYEDYMEAYGDESHQHHDLASKVRKRPAKQTNFLLSYGGTDQTLSHRLIIPLATATGIMDSTLTLYSGIPATQDATLKFAREHGYAETAYGTRRHASDELFSKSKGPVNRQVRQLYNARIQGCAADILKVVLADCEKSMIWDRFNAIMVAPVYDEVVAFVPYENAWDYVQEMRSIMNLTPPGQAVPMVADISIGPNWQIQHELGHQPTKEEFDKVLHEDVIPVVEEIWDRIDDYRNNAA